MIDVFDSARLVDVAAPVKGVGRAAPARRLDLPISSQYMRSSDVVELCIEPRQHVGRRSRGRILVCESENSSANKLPRLFADRVFQFSIDV